MNDAAVTADEIVSRLAGLADPRAAEGMARYGITGKKIYGIKLPCLRWLAKEIGENRRLALELWNVNSRETRIVASLIDNPAEVTETQMETWVREFDSWEICDQICMNLFEKTPFAYLKAVEWCHREKEFVKRAGFVLMARLAVSDKISPDEKFEQFFPLIKRESDDPRIYVKKGINWALRQIGKRNLRLNMLAVKTARDIQKKDSSAAGWIASDALRELTGKSVQSRLLKKNDKKNRRLRK